MANDFDEWCRRLITGYFDDLVEAENPDTLFEKIFDGVVKCLDAAVEIAREESEIKERVIKLDMAITWIYAMFMASALPASEATDKRLAELKKRIRLMSVMMVLATGKIPTRKEEEKPFYPFDSLGD